jgi:hypothetical protein
MKAPHLIDSASYGPDALKAIGQAFDEAWREIAGNFGSDPVEIEAARLKLANAVLSVAAEDSRDAEALKNGAPQAMALRYREAPPTKAGSQAETVLGRNQARIMRVRFPSMALARQAPPTERAHGLLPPVPRRKGVRSHASFHNRKTPRRSPPQLLRWYCQRTAARAVGPSHQVSERQGRGCVSP